MTETTNPSAKMNKKRGLMVLGAGCGCLFLIILISVGIYLYAGWQGYQESPMFVEVQKKGIQLSDPYTLSSAQEESLFSYGYPEAFTILFYEEEVVSGAVAPVRLETWDYYSQGLSLTFINGDLIAEDRYEIVDPGSLESLPYFPEQFSAFMSLDEVITAAGIDSYVEIPLEKEFIEDGIVYYAYSLTFGLKNNELLYIEALALSE